MFSTVLKEITGYFGKSFFISVFFPSLFFWMLNLALGVLTVGLEKSLKWWEEGLNGQVQTFLTVAFVIWVFFAAYVLHIFMGELTKLYEGRWGFLKFIPAALQKRSEKKWKALRTRDEELGEQIRALKARQEALEKLLDRDVPPLPYGTRVDVPLMAQEASALYDQVRDWTTYDYLDDDQWKEMEKQLSSLQARILGLSEEELDQHRAELGPGSKADLAFRAPYEFLKSLIGQLEQDRLAVYEEWSVAFPAAQLGEADPTGQPPARRRDLFLPALQPGRDRHLASPARDTPGKVCRPPGRSQDEHGSDAGADHPGPHLWHYLGRDLFHCAQRLVSCPHHLTGQPGDRSRGLPQRCRERPVLR